MVAFLSCSSTSRIALRARSRSSCAICALCRAALRLAAAVRGGAGIEHEGQCGRGESTGTGAARTLLLAGGLLVLLDLCSHCGRHAVLKAVALDAVCLHTRTSGRAPRSGGGGHRLGSHTAEHDALEPDERRAVGDGGAQGLGALLRHADLGEPEHRGQHGCDGMRWDAMRGKGWWRSRRAHNTRPACVREQAQGRAVAEHTGKGLHTGIAQWVVVQPAKRDNGGGLGEMTVTRGAGRGGGHTYRSVLSESWAGRPATM